MKWKNRDAREEPPREALVGSVLVHGVVLVVAVALSFARPEPLPFETFQIEIVSAPPVQSDEVQEEAPAEELVVETPDEPEPVEEETVIPEPAPEPEPTPPEPDPEPEVTPPDLPSDSVEVEATTTEEVEETVEESGEDVTVRMEGLRRDYPTYYRNIITQIQRCFRPPQNAPAGLSTVVYFVISVDGTVREQPRVVERSGSGLFDGRAVQAIAGCASGRFGELPRDLGYERLPIQFEFTPGRDGAPASHLPTPDDA